MSSDIADLQALAQQRSDGLGAPSSKWEAWRYVNLKAQVPESNTRLPGEAVSDCGVSHPHRLLIENGQITPVNLPDCATLSDPDSACREAWLRMLANTDDPSLAWAFADDGDTRTLHLSQSCELAIGIGVCRGRSGGALRIHLAPHADVSLICYGNLRNGHASLLLDVVAEANSHLRVREWHAGSDHSQVFFHRRMQIARDASVDWTCADDGAFLLRHTWEAELTDTNSHCSLQAVNPIAGRRQAHHYSRVIHHVGHTVSEQRFRSVARERSRYSFDGLVTMLEGADLANADQQSVNLLIGEQARIDARPQLDIRVDDVSATHGCSIGQLDEGLLYYLRCRGIKRAAAEAMLLRGFICAPLDHCPDDEREAWLSERQAMIGD